MKFIECTSNPETWAELLSDPPGLPQTTSNRQLLVGNTLRSEGI